MKKILFVLFTVSSLMSVHAEPEIKGTAEELTKFINGVSSTTTVRVSSKKTVKSDKVLVHFVISSSEDSLKEAIDENVQILTRIKQQLNSIGINSKSISPKAFSTLPSYSFYSKKPTSYKAKKTVSVEVQSENDLVKVLGVLDNFKDETRFLRMTFEFSEREKIEKELLLKNFDKAAERKVIFEKGLGVKLRIKTFTEGKGIMVATQGNQLQQGLNQKFTSGVRALSIDNNQWLASDQSQKGFAEFEIVRALEVVYLVED